jgi:hypothetical protein
MERRNPSENLPEFNNFPSLKEDRDNLVMIGIRFIDAAIYIQLNRGERVATLNKEVTIRMNESGQGGEWEVEGGPAEVIDPERVYQVREQPPKRMTIYLKQENFEVEENESREHVSDRFAASKGLQRLAQFKIFPVDNQVQRIDDDPDNAYSIE